MEENVLITIHEVAEYLKVSDKVVTEMIHSGILTKLGTGKNARIDKNQVDAWLESLTQNEAEDLAMKRVICHFQDYFKVENILLEFHADHKYDAISEMSKKARDLKIVKDHRWLYEVVVAREELVSTAIGRGIAMLHPRHMHPTKIKYPTVLFGRSSVEVDFDAPDDLPVNLFFMLLLHNDKQHLFSLSYITKFLMNEENIKILRNAKTPDAVYKAITGFDSTLKKKN